MSGSGNPPALTVRVIVVPRWVVFTGWTQIIPASIGRWPSVF